MEGNEDVLMEDAVLYLQKQRYRDGLSKNEKRTIRRKATRFTLRNGELLYTKKDKMKVRYITNPKERKQILEDCHFDATSGHMGTKKTLARITERFIWAGVAKDVYSLVHKCDTCQRMTKKIKTGTPELHPVPVVSTWYHLGIDFVGPLAYQSKQGNVYILTVSDYFSKFVQAIPCKNKEASTVCEALFQLFMQFGIPKAITTDQGTEFNNALDKKMMKQLNINHRLTTPYHPQANGLVERFNQTIQNMFVKYVQDKKQDWEDYISTCVYAYNTSKHESSKFCPFTVMFGRSAVLPIDLKLSSDVATSPKADQNTDAMIEENQIYREKMMEKVKANIVAAQSRQKEQYDRKHHDREIFAEGALVLKKDMTRKKRAGGKMDNKWIGPYRIVKSMGKGLYQIESADQFNVKIQRVHGIHLKPFYPSAKTVSMAGLPHQTDISNIVSNSSIESSSNDYEVSFEVSVTNSSNQDHYCSDDKKFSSEYSPVTQSKAAEFKVVKCEDTVADSKAAQSKCAEPKAAQHTAADFTAAEYNDTSFKTVDSGGAKYKDMGSNSTESKGFESDTTDCLGTGSISAESMAACSMGDNSMAAEFKETNLCETPSTPSRLESLPLNTSTPYQTRFSSTILSPELSTGFTCSTLIEEGGYFSSFPDDISAIVDEWNANIKDDALLVSTREMNLEDKAANIVNDILEGKSCKRRLTFLSPDKEEKVIPSKRKRKLISHDMLVSNATCDAKEQVKRIWQGKPSHVVKARIGNCSVYHGSFHTLKGSGFLNDEIVNTYLKLLASIHQNCHVIISQTMTALINRMPSKNKFHLLSKEELCNKKFIVGIYNQGGIHWVLIVIDLHKRCFYYLDPFGPTRMVRGAFTALK